MVSGIGGEVGIGGAVASVGGVGADRCGCDIGGVYDALDDDEGTSGRESAGRRWLWLLLWLWFLCVCCRSRNRSGSRSCSIRWRGNCSSSCFRLRSRGLRAQRRRYRGFDGCRARGALRASRWRRRSDDRVRYNRRRRDLARRCWCWCCGRIGSLSAFPALISGHDRRARHDIILRPTVHTHVLLVPFVRFRSPSRHTPSFPQRPSAPRDARRRTIQPRARSRARQPRGRC